MRAVVAVAALAGTAHAQAPGEVAPQPAAPPASGVMADRWAIDAALWAGSVTARTDGATAVSVGGFALAGRFRVRPDIELALALDAGGGGNNTIAMGGLAAEFRYRFVPENPWNFIVLGGLGVASIAGKDASMDDKRGRGELRLGGGVERRFDAFAVEADLRLLSIGANANALPPRQSPPSAADEVARYAVSGLTLTLGATYYF